jgi:hypothetical protein
MAGCRTQPEDRVTGLPPLRAGTTSPVSASPLSRTGLTCKPLANKLAALYKSAESFQ